MSRYVHLSLHGGLDFLSDIGGKRGHDGVVLSSLLLLGQSSVGGNSGETSISSFSSWGEFGQSSLVSSFSSSLLSLGLGLEGVEGVLQFTTCLRKELVYRLRTRGKYYSFKKYSKMLSK